MNVVSCDDGEVMDEGGDEAEKMKNLVGDGDGWPPHQCLCLQKVTSVKKIGAPYLPKLDLNIFNTYQGRGS